MTDIKRIGDSGIHTVEGNVAGARAARLTKQREAQQQQYELVKNKIKEENATGIGRIDDKFNSGSDRLEQEFRQKTIGLVSAEDFRKLKNAVDNSSTNLEAEQQDNKNKAMAMDMMKKAQRAEKRKKMQSTLSFDVCEGEGEGDGAQEMLNSNSNPMKKKTLKNPSVDTAFLPDKERDEKLEYEKRRLQEEWLQAQETLKNEVNRSKDINAIVRSV